MEDTLVFIDEGFLSKLSRYFGDGKYLKINYFKFARNLSKKQGLFCKHIFYATAPPFQSGNPTADERKRKEGYDKFKSRFENRKDFTFLEGRVQRLKVNGEFKYKQKAVDTLLTMVLGSMPSDFSKIKKIILVACDSDFCPVIEKLKSKGIQVILYSYYEKTRDTDFSRSYHLISCCSNYIKLKIEDFKEAQFDKK
jgi:uncharacterized LabA/DUF88 family protein